MTKKFKIAVLVATTLGCGIAYEGGENVVLIDNGADLASDYTRTLRPMEAVESGGIVANERISRGLVVKGVSTPARTRAGGDIIDLFDNPTSAYQIGDESRQFD